jgi:hypothetical protein
MSEQHSSRNTPEMELFELADKVDPESADGIFLNAVADGITDARLDGHRLDDILDEEV